MNAPTSARVVVVGGGIAGLATALKLAPLPVTVLVKAPLGTEASTPWAQGGIAAAIGEDDAHTLHAADTLVAAAGVGDHHVANRVTAEAAACIEDLLSYGIEFDRDANGEIALGLEAAHSRRRIVHAGGDSTGLEAINTLIRAVRRTPSIEVLDDVRVTELLVDEGAVRGVQGVRGGAPFYRAARAVVLATGGAGGLYVHTTNPLGSVGSGFVLAARAGALLRDVEFVQFHPTAMAVGRDPMPLATEALRGEGATLVNQHGERFMDAVPGRELAPRDVVARGIWKQIEVGNEVFLDARTAVGERFPKRFPGVYALCKDAGLDPVRQMIPVRPAAHYHMGGIAVDERGRSSIDGLWACGEVAATGLHGANRLASNSLLEALAYARWIAADIQGINFAQRSRPIVVNMKVGTSAFDADAMKAVRQLMTRHVGVVRNAEGLTAAARNLRMLAQASGVVADAALAGLCITIAALERCESRGAHCRDDFPQPAMAWQRHLQFTLDEIRQRTAVLDGALQRAQSA
ncbi:MAG TPA: L-aspartate oxidase [Steroidobacteraceae bacterium]|nr:L-aspartate oxidase [Steroidobacteraceae bacterium]